MKHAAQALDGSTGCADVQPGLRAWWRRTTRVAAALVVMLALAAAWFLGLPFTWGSPARRRRWRRVVFQAWSRSMLAICRVRVRVVGSAPREPSFLVANHLGYVDVLVIAARVDATFVSMKELDHWPFFGLMARQFGTVFIDRSRKRDLPGVNLALEGALVRSDVVVVFPEGRHTRGKSVLPFRPSLLEPAARGGQPVAWAVLHYATTGEGDPPASRSIPWVDVSFARQALVLLALGGVDATLEFGSDTVRGDDRKVLAEELHRRVVGRFRALE